MTAYDARNTGLEVYDRRVKQESEASVRAWEEAQKFLTILAGIKEKGSLYWKRWDAQVRELVPCGVYIHHKSTIDNTKHYLVLGAGERTE